MSKNNLRIARSSKSSSADQASGRARGYRRRRGRDIAHDRVKQPTGGKIVAWELFTEWSDLQFVNYSISEDLEDATIAAWRMEDWEIYGPGAGGYSSSGPYGDWQSDILSWLNNGSMIAQDIIDWDASQLQTHNLSTHTQDSAGLTALTTYYLNGSSYLPQDPNPTFGLVATAQYVEGDIVVTGARSHSDQSISYRFATVDPFTHQSVTWVENVSFLDSARANADANVVKFDLAEGELPLTEDEEAAIAVIREARQDLIDSLQQLDRDGYFQIEGWGRIRVSEMLSLLLRADWVIHPSTHFSPSEIGYTDRHGGDPILELNRSTLSRLAVEPSLLYSYLVHEITHTTRVAWDHRSNTVPYETRTNDVTRAILIQIGIPFGVYSTPGGGYGSTQVVYHPNLPVT
jgi:hypothetical protein